MAKESLDKRTKTKLFDLVNQMENLVNKHLEQWESDEVNYALSTWEQQLKFDLSREFKERKTADLKESPFDDLLNDL